MSQIIPFKWRNTFSKKMNLVCINCVHRKKRADRLIMLCLNNSVQSLKGSSCKYFKSITGDKLCRK